MHYDVGRFRVLSDRKLLYSHCRFAENDEIARVAVLFLSLLYIQIAYKYNNIIYACDNKIYSADRPARVRCDSGLI